LIKTGGSAVHGFIRTAVKELKWTILPSFMGYLDDVCNLLLPLLLFLNLSTQMTIKR